MRIAAVVRAIAVFLLCAAACSDSDSGASGMPKATVGRPKTTRDKDKHAGTLDAGDEPASGSEGAHDGSGGSNHHVRDGGGEMTMHAAGDAGHSQVDLDAATPHDPGSDDDADEDAGSTAPPVIHIDYNGEFPPAQNLPTPKGECPVFVTGVQDYTFNVQGGRQVLIGVDPSKAPAKGPGGPLIFYWHGTGSGPTEAGFGLGNALNAVVDEGGLVAGFYSTMNYPDKGKCDECKTNTGNGVWFIEDFNLADEVLACAIQQLHIDTRRIHAAGMSAGGLQVSAMLYARSNYMASVAPYSGGILTPWKNQDPTNPVAAMIFHGTYADDVVGLHFYSTSKTLFDDIKKRGGFAVDCNHGGAHIIPADGWLAVWTFFQYHPYKTSPSPWANMLPAGLPAYCSLTFQ
jgi:predicted esterase